MNFSNIKVNDYVLFNQKGRKFKGNEGVEFYIEGDYKNIGQVTNISVECRDTNYGDIDYYTFTIKKYDGSIINCSDEWWFITSIETYTRYINDEINKQVKRVELLSVIKESVSKYL